MAELAKIGSSALSAMASIQQGRYADRSAKSIADQLRNKKNEVNAIAQRRAIEARRQSNLQIGAAQAAVAASGGDTTDVTVSNLIGDLQDEGTASVMARLYEGQTEGANLEFEAKTARAQGRMARRQSVVKAGAQLLDGVSGTSTGGIKADFGKVKSTGRSLASKAQTLYSKYGT